MRLIDADALKQVICQDQCDHMKETCDADCELIAYITNAPTVDAMPVKHGRWEEQTVDSYEENAVIADWQSAKCSECGRYLTTPYLYYFTKYNFCPKCGAKMDGERRENE